MSAEKETFNFQHALELTVAIFLGGVFGHLFEVYYSLSDPTSQGAFSVLLVFTILAVSFLFYFIIYLPEIARRHLATRFNKQHNEPQKEPQSEDAKKEVSSNSLNLREEFRNRKI